MMGDGELIAFSCWVAVALVGVNTCSRGIPGGTSGISALVFMVSYEHSCPIFFIDAVGVASRRGPPSPSASAHACVQER